MKLHGSMLVVTFAAFLCWTAKSTLFQGERVIGSVLVIAVSAAWIFGAILYCSMMLWMKIRRRLALGGEKLLYAFLANFATVLAVLMLPIWMEGAFSGKGVSTYTMFPPPPPWYSDLQVTAYIFISALTFIWAFRAVQKQQMVI